MTAAVYVESSAVLQKDSGLDAGQVRAGSRARQNLAHDTFKRQHMIVAFYGNFGQFFGHARAVAAVGTEKDDQESPALELDQGTLAAREVGQLEHHRDNRLVRRKGRVYVINKTQRRFKARQG